MKALYEPTRNHAAKIVAKHLGHAGRVGGWIYTANGRPIAHGWHAYGYDLERDRVLVKRTVTDPKSGKPVARWAINWKVLR